MLAGQPYYIEALQKEAAGGDNLAVGWAQPGQTTSTPSEVIPGWVLLPWTGYDPNHNFGPTTQVCRDYSINEGPVTLQLTAQVKDDGHPRPASPQAPNENDPNKLRWAWSVISLPADSHGVIWSGASPTGEAFTYEGSNHAPQTVFVCDPCATFDVPGCYQLEFRATDGEKETVKPINISIRSTGIYRQMGYSYLSPVPFAQYVPADNDFILVRFTEITPRDLLNRADFITVTGSISGIHSGQTHVASDQRTVIFTVDSDFEPSETVTITLNPQVHTQAIGKVEPYQYQFAVSDHLPDQASGSISSAALTHSTVIPSDQASMLENGVSVPSNFPYIEITTHDDPNPGLIFMDNRTSGADSYNVIFDNNGLPVWYWQTDDERRDMKVQPNGLLTMLARDGGTRFIGLNRHYQQVAEYRAVNGYSTDEHELVVLENGSYFLIGLNYETVDMTRYLSDGDPEASVRETVIQGFTPEGELILQWRAWDNYNVWDVELDDPRDASLRFPHMNAIDIDHDGNLLVSCRHLNEVTKLNRETGQVIWRLSGAHSDFTFVNDPLNGFRNQHAIRATDPNRYLLFDNGDLHTPPMSRAVEYELNTDPNEMTATIVWQYPDPATTDIYSHYMANTQRLPHGNTLINWAVGHLPKLTEVRPDGTVALELNWFDQSEAYRVWKCPWDGRALTPYLIIEPQVDNITLIYNQFGDPNVAFYRIYGDTSPQPQTLLLETEQTLAYLTDLQNHQHYYFRVTSVDTQGMESDFSNEEDLFVTLNQMNRELVTNGDFSQDKEGWAWELQGGQADWEIIDGVAHIIIDHGGTPIYGVQLRQAGIPLIQGQTYVFEFDAWADQGRIIEAKVGQDHSPHTNYSRIGYTYVTTHKQRFSYTFTMNEATDTNARVVINTGMFNSNVYLDNLSIKQQP